MVVVCDFGSRKSQDEKGALGWPRPHLLQHVVVVVAAEEQIDLGRLLEKLDVVGLPRRGHTQGTWDGGDGQAQRSRAPGGTGGLG
eukprot:1056426-Prymnesium_polylepis.1